MDITSPSQSDDQYDEEIPDILADLPFEDDSDSRLSDVITSVIELRDDVVGLAILM